MELLHSDADESYRIHQKRNKTSPETLQTHIQALSGAFTDLNLVLNRRYSLIDRESEAKIVLDDALFTDVQGCYVSAKGLVQTASDPSSPMALTTPETAHEISEYVWPMPPSSTPSDLPPAPPAKEADIVPIHVAKSEPHRSNSSERDSIQLNEDLDVRPQLQKHSSAAIERITSKHHHSKSTGNELVQVNEHLDTQRPVQRESCAVEPLSIRPKEIPRIVDKELPTISTKELPKILTKELPEISTEESPGVDSSLTTNVKHQGSPDPEDDPEPDFKDPGFPPAVYAELIATLQREVKLEMKAERFDRAELAQLKTISYLTKREISLHIPYDVETKTQMNETLATIYIKRKQHDRAKDILNSLLKQEKANSDRKWQYYYMVAGVYLEQKRIPEAEKFAKRAYSGRESTLGKGHGLILESAAQLVQIYEAKGEKDTAQAFRNLYDNSAQRNQPPQITKHIGTKRVKWNPDISVDINALQKNGETALITAVTCGDEEMLQRVLQAGADLEVQGPDGMTPLMHAVWHGHVKIAGVLLSRGAKVDAPTAGWTPLHKASDIGDLDMMTLLLQNGADIEAKSPKKLILKKHAVPPPLPPHPATLKPSPQQPTYLSPASDSDSDSSSTTSTPKSHGWTPLLRASASPTGAEPTIHLLLSRSANIEARSPSAATPLILATEAQHLPTVSLLLHHNASVSASDSFGWKPLHRTLVRPSGRSTEIAQALLDASADINAVDLYKKTPLHHAIEKNDEEMALFLLRRGADIEAVDVAGRTPLWLAIECRWEGGVFLLLESGADAGRRGREGRDAVGVACKALRRSPEIVKLLKEHRKRTVGLGGKGRRDSRATSVSSTVVGSGMGEGGSLGSESGGGGGWWSRMGRGGKGKK